MSVIIELRGGAVVARLVHTQKVEDAISSPATNYKKIMEEFPKIAYDIMTEISGFDCSKLDKKSAVAVFQMIVSDYDELNDVYAFRERLKNVVRVSTH